MFLPNTYISILYVCSGLQVHLHLTDITSQHKTSPLYEQVSSLPGRWSGEKQRGAECLHLPPLPPHSSSGFACGRLIIAATPKKAE